MSITDQLRKCLVDCGRTRYAVSQSTGIDQAALKRFAEGGDARGQTLDKLARYFQLELKPRRVAK